MMYFPWELERGGGNVSGDLGTTSGWFVMERGAITEDVGLGITGDVGHQRTDEP